MLCLLCKPYNISNAVTKVQYRQYFPIINNVMVRYVRDLIS